MDITCKAVCTMVIPRCFVETSAAFISVSMTQEYCVKMNLIIMNTQLSKLPQDNLRMQNQQNTLERPMVTFVYLMFILNLCRNYCTKNNQNHQHCHSCLAYHAFFLITDMLIKFIDPFQNKKAWHRFFMNSFLKSLYIYKYLNQSILLSLK